MPDNASLKRLSGLHLGLGILTFAVLPPLFLLLLPLLPGGPWGGPLTLLGFLTLLALAVALMASSRAIDVRRLRPFSLACSGLMLLLFPVGSAIGIYSLRVLTRRETIAEYARGRMRWPE
jgi:hypothetical protein